MLAKAEDIARAGMDNAGGGSSRSRARARPRRARRRSRPPSAAASSVILTTGSISAKAQSLNDADACTTSVSGGLLRISTYSATATMDPTVTVIVTGGA